MASTLSISQVRVAVRARPLTSAERGRGGKDVINVNRHSRTVSIGNGNTAGRCFTYDSVFDSSVSQNDLYRDISKSLLGSFLDGYNATILAYGQTGSGKTFTMGSEALQGYDCNVDTRGLLPRFLEDIFASVATQKMQGAENEKNVSNVEISASFLEVYGEDVFDLLVEDRRALAIREDANGEVIVSGLRKVAVSSVEEAMDVLNEGTMHRTTAATLMNHTSSRSHAVFTISMVRTESSDGDNISMTASSRMTFVDLAGSERMKRTGAEGERAREGIKINEGLLALGNVINALADEERLSKGGKVHVPYRQSKLTRLLQDALGGNSQTLFLACVSPSDTNASETLCTLQYANRARNIKNAVTKNVDPTLMELQRLNVLTGVLQYELVKNRFMQCHSLSTIQESENNELPMVSVSSSPPFDSYEDLLQRDDVQEYMGQLYKKVAEKCAGNPNSSFKQANQFSINTSSVVTSSYSSPHRGVIITSPLSSRRISAELSIVATDDVGTALQDLNPDDDMAMLDQLLELQRKEKEFDDMEKLEKESLEKVESELKDQENMLLQLRENLKTYHTIKAKYEALMVEVLNLEKEKSRLAEDLQKALSDPSKGCSKTLQQKLGGVEVKIQRARNEARKHQTLYKKAEQEAQRCKVLERKINDLKYGKTELIRKQREAAAKHREYIESKTREINNLKKKERINGQRVSKLQQECKRQQATLERRKQYCDKLNSKLKETEKHLMKYLKVRSKEKNSKAGGDRNIFKTPENADFAPMSDEIKSIKFLLDRTVFDRVKDCHSTELYKEKMAEYGDLMQAMVDEVKHCNSLKQADKSEWSREDIEESEQNIECIEVKLELIGSELNDLREMLPETDAEVDEDNPKSHSKSKEDNVQQMVAKLSGASARTILWQFLNDMTKSEFRRVKADEVLKRKDLTIQSFESEIDILNKKLQSVSNDYERRKSLANKFSSNESDDLLGKVLDLETEIVKMNEEMHTKQQNIVKLGQQLAESKAKLEKSRCDFANQQERMILYETAQKNNTSLKSAENVLNELQSIWSQLGVSDGERRERAKRKLDTCLEDTCNVLLVEAKDLQKRKREEITIKQTQALNMVEALGSEDEKYRIQNLDQDSSMAHRMDMLEDIHKKLYPKYSAAMQRKEKIAKEVKTIIKTMEPLQFDLKGNLQLLLSSQGKGLKHKKKKTAALLPQMQEVDKMLAMLGESNEANEDPDEEDSLVDTTKIGMIVSFDDLEPGLLSNSFLDDCEKELKLLRQRKAEMMSDNNETLAKVQNLVEKMNLTGRASTYLVNKVLERKPIWWDHAVCKNICQAVSSENLSNVVEVNGIYTKHLNLVYEALDKLARQRSIIAEKLKDLLNDAYMTIVNKVKIREVHDSFHDFKDGLLSLPSLSQEYVEAYIDEMSKLVSLVKNMFQSDREALIHVWERNSVTSSENAMFWTQLEDLCKMEDSAIFNSIEQEFNSSDDYVESWIMASIKDASYTHSLLETSLFKWLKVNEELDIQVEMEQRINKIMELDGEINAMNFQLDNFEHGSKDKQERLITKKENSAWLLREEKYRKQMQSKFTSLLEELTQLLDEWEKQEGSPFNADDLSEDVRNLLGKDNKMRAVEERTAFMHLKTVRKIKKPRSDEKKMIYQDRVNHKHSRESTMSTTTKTPKLNTNNNTTATASKPGLHQRSDNKRLVRSHVKPIKSQLGQHKTPTKRKHLSGKMSENTTASSNLLLQIDESESMSKSKSILFKKHLSISTDVSSNEKTPPILPFGNLLETPTRQKENITPN